MYGQKGFVTDTQSITMKIVTDYLSSTYCLDSFSNLVVEQALRNEHTVLPGLYNLLTNYLKTEHRYLEGLIG